MSIACKMRITGYEDSEYKTLLGEVVAQINPATIRVQKGIHYNEDITQGSGNKEANYNHHKEDVLSFKWVLDGTGVVPDLLTVIPVADRLEKIHKILYQLNSSTHESAYLIIAWGGFLFRGRLQSLTEEYVLFSPVGIPLRVNLDFSFISHMDKEEANKEEGKESPDLSRVIVLKAGESIALWCHRIYGDASYCMDVAAWNGLSEFRNIKPGVSVLFPPLNRYGRFIR